MKKFMNDIRVTASLDCFAPLGAYVAQDGDAHHSKRPPMR